MKLSEFDYELPGELIAQQPSEERDGARMMLVERATGEWGDGQFRDFPELLSGDELIVVNNARVIPARLLGRRVGVKSEAAGKRTGKEYLTSAIEVLLTRQVAGDEWEGLVRPGRKVRVGERISFGNGELESEVLERGEYGLRRLRLRAQGDVRTAIEKVGHIPLPPYIDRADEAADRVRYQTIFAKVGMAVAAPTAGLHFTEKILERVRARGVEVCELTLRVGAGTFQPIHEEEIERHRMGMESYEIPEATAKRITEAKREGRPVLAVGTTVVRTLEDAVRRGGQTARERAAVPAGAGEAELFIRPGHEFLVVDQLLTNFHSPKSSLLILVCAFAERENALRAYRHAVEARYRFYSYGDCMLIR